MEIEEMNILGKKAKEASLILALKTAEEKKQALKNAAVYLLKNKDFIYSQNKEDILAAKENGLRDSLIDRLTLNEARLNGIAKSLEEIAEEPDPIGKVLEEFKPKNGLLIKKVSVPLGVVGIIYEARPNVTADAAAICLKSGNACILRGGKEAIRSNTAIADILNKSFLKSGIPEGTLQLVTDTSRSSAKALMKCEYLNVIIPRGSASLIKTTVTESIVPVIETGTGNCHCFVDEFADTEMALNIVENAKCSRVSVCNALETLLVHKEKAKEFLPKLSERLKKYNCKLLGCEKTVKIIKAEKAAEEDYATEFLDYILAVKVVDDLSEAIEHIKKYSTGHSEAIVTENAKNAERFLNEIDSAAVYWNASTRFTDGGEFGFGAEIGISTQKIHARGPMGAKHLTSYKYICLGKGEIR